MPSSSKRKGTKYENEIVKEHKKLGVEAQRVPLSGAMEGWKGDVRVYLDQTRFNSECKIRSRGFEQLYNWLADNDLLFCRKAPQTGMNIHNKHPTIVTMTWEMYAYLITRGGPQDGEGAADSDDRGQTDSVRSVLRETS